MNALDIITDAMERMNRLSPGETLADDDKAFALRRLNLLCDELSAQTPFLYRDVLTSAAQSGHITLGAGSWAAVPIGAEIVGMTVDGTEATRLTMAQYACIYDRTQTGSPTNYAQDGLSTVYLYPVATGQTIVIHHRTGAAAFADLATEYSTKPGYEAFLGAALAVRCAPTIIGKLSPDLVRAEKRLESAVRTYEPAVVDVYGYQGGGCEYNIQTG